MELLSNAEDKTKDFECLTENSLNVNIWREIFSKYKT